MKKKLGMIMGTVIIAAFVLAGCGSDDKASANVEREENVTATSTSDSEGFTFEASGTVVAMNEEMTAVLAGLGEEKDYFEAESCAFQGLDKTYTYSGFRLYTYPVDEVDYVYSVELMDDTVSTSEGVAIGDGADKVTEIYGEDYEGDGSKVMTFIKGDSKLQFLLSDGSVSAIEYMAIME